MKKCVSSLNFPIGVFTNGRNQNNDNPIVSYMNFCTKMGQLRRDPTKVAAINYDISRQSGRIRNITKPDEFYFSKNWELIRDFSIWPKGNGLITNDPEITLVNGLQDAVYFYNTHETVVGTAVCSMMTLSAQAIVSKMIAAMRDYDCKIDDICVDYPATFTPVMLNYFTVEGIKERNLHKIDEQYDLLLCWKEEGAS